jgi:ATP-binding cassette subfamily B protein
LQANDTIGSRVISNIDKTLLKSSTLTFISEILIRSIYPLALGFISYVTLKSMDFGSFVALTVAASTLSNIVWNLSDNLASFEAASVRGETVFAIMNQKGVIEISGTKEAETLEKIEIKNLHFSYGETKVLEDINLTITKGDKIAVVGENGAGKTTFVKMLLRLYDPQEGKIIYNKELYQDLKPESIRKKIGAVFQDFQVYSFSISENILLRKSKNKEDEELVIEALKFSGLYEKVMSFPKQLDTIITQEFDKEGVELSSGEKQKLAIARAYAGNYDFIILDEPSSALDPIAEAEIYDKMMKLGKDRTLLFVSHRLSTTVKANKIYLFSAGKVIEEGTHHDLMQMKDGQYQYMFNIQALNYLNGVKANENI